MEGSEANILCSHSGDILAYLYKEMEGADRDTFEVHLAECGTCIDDFAELSQSRYPIYEWKRSEFDPLPTPRVVIPFGETDPISWFDKIRAAFSFRPTLAFGGLGAAILVAMVAGYFILGTTSGSTEVAQEVEPSASPERRAVVIPSPSVNANSETSAEVEVREETPKAVKVSSSARPAVRSPKAKPSQRRKQDDSIPAMSLIEDDEDDSLRLVDIFDEVGTSE